MRPPLMFLIHWEDSTVKALASPWRYLPDNSSKEACCMHNDFAYTFYYLEKKLSAVWPWKCYLTFLLGVCSIIYLPGRSHKSRNVQLIIVWHFGNVRFVISSLLMQAALYFLESTNLLLISSIWVLAPQAELYFLCYPWHQGQKDWCESYSCHRLPVVGWYYAHYGARQYDQKMLIFSK